MTHSTMSEHSYHRATSRSYGKGVRTLSYSTYFGQYQGISQLYILELLPNVRVL